MTHGSEEALTLSEFVDKTQKHAAESQRRLSVYLVVG